MALQNCLKYIAKKLSLKDVRFALVGYRDFDVEDNRDESTEASWLKTLQKQSQLSAEELKKLPVRLCVLAYALLCLFTALQARVTANAFTSNSIISAILECRRQTLRWHCGGLKEGARRP